MYDILITQRPKNILIHNFLVQSTQNDDFDALAALTIYLYNRYIFLLFSKINYARNK